MDLDLSTPPLQSALHNLDLATADCGLADEMIQRLRVPRECIELSLPTLHQSGAIRLYKAYIIHHSRTLGPAKGGIRMTPGVSMDEVLALAMEMTWKTALMEIPFGGGKSGIVADPAALHPKDREQLIREYGRSGLRHIGPELYIPAPDMGTNERDMGHLRDCISHSAGFSIPRGCYVTGKPVLLGGIEGRREATGRGVALTIFCALKRLGLEPEDVTAAIQGFGNVGAVAAAELYALGIRILAVSDIHSAIYNARGLEIPTLIQHYRQEPLASFREAEPIEHSALLELPCTLLVPAAAGNQITGANADRIRARLIAEGANGPISPEADTVLESQGKTVIPDILCNAGGVYVSYLEYTQETQREQLSLEAVNQRLEQNMRRKFEQVFATAERHGISPRRAAMRLAVRRVADAILARGDLP